MEGTLQSKRILVTGAGDGEPITSFPHPSNPHLPLLPGIGRDLCKHLHKLGAQVIAVARQESQLQSLKKETSDDLETVIVDLMNWQDTKAALSNLGPIDGLVNNAGVAVIKPFAEITEDDFDK